MNQGRRDQNTQLDGRFTGHWSPMHHPTQPVVSHFTAHAQVFWGIYSKTLWLKWWDIPCNQFVWHWYYNIPKFTCIREIGYVTCLSWLVHTIRTLHQLRVLNETWEWLLNGKDNNAMWISGMTKNKSQMGWPIPWLEIKSKGHEYASGSLTRSSIYGDFLRDFYD
jgi:hypothetical protein